MLWLPSPTMVVETTITDDAAQRLHEWFQALYTKHAPASSVVKAIEQEMLYGPPKGTPIAAPAPGA